MKKRFDNKIAKKAFIFLWKVSDLDIKVRLSLLMSSSYKEALNFVKGLVRYSELDFTPTEIKKVTAFICDMGKESTKIAGGSSGKSHEQSMSEVDIKRLEWVNPENLRHGQKSTRDMIRAEVEKGSEETLNFIIDALAKLILQITFTRVNLDEADLDDVTCISAGISSTKIWNRERIKRFVDKVVPGVTPSVFEAIKYGVNEDAAKMFNDFWEQAQSK